ncbi:MAG: recombinase family protein, partial [Oscillospiraceae bacterium]|nr:recombinase family protein [Oscillospiraceae bacterium]
TAKRDGFNRMVADALANKIDLIVTKSVSRFARNTVDSLSTIRKLKEHGTEVYFEKENIWTFDGKGELLITIMSSLAQEESRSISENVKWGHRKRFSDGKVCVPYSRFLGYDKGENGVLKLNEKEAVIIQLIYRMFLEGATPHIIAKHLTDEGIPSPARKVVWSQVTVRAILTNEKYKGDALLQKSYIEDFLTKKQVINNGEIQQYYVENAHEAIIEPVVFEMVQQEMRKRKNGTNRHSGVGMFASRIKCGECGSWYGSKVWHSNNKYRRTIYQCNHKFKNEKKCGTPHLEEETIKRLFVFTVNKLLADKDEIIANFLLMRDDLFGTAVLETVQNTLQDEMAVVTELMQKCIEENARIALNQTDYEKRYNGLVLRFDTAKTRFEEVSASVSSKKAQGELVGVFIAELARRDGLVSDFDERLWFSLVDFATVYSETDVRFTFKNGMEITA